MSTFETTRRAVRRAGRTTLVAARPSWISGAARLVDLGGVFDRYAFRIAAHQTPSEALASDWNMVGGDLESAIRAYRPARKTK